MTYATMAYIQQLVIDSIHKKGGRITFKKELGKMATLMYKLKNKEPIINVEALILGERIGVLIGYPNNYQKITNNEKYKIFHIQNIDDFNKEFEEFVTKKIKS